MLLSLKFFLFFKQIYDHKSKVAKIASYYDLDPQISYKNILTRCADETKKNNMYLTTEGVREVVEANKERVKIINTGVKAFARFDHF